MIARATTIFVLGILTTGANAAKVAEPRCEYVKNPLGIDTPRPRLSWIIASDRRGARQTAYEVLVASSPRLLAKNQGDLWRSGKIASDDSIQIAYAGRPLASNARCFWKVRIWDQNDRPSAWSEPAFWTMGLLSPDDWQARWIRAGDPAPASAESSPDQAVKGSLSPWMRKTFVLKAEPKRALAYVNALGYYELHVNGRKVGADVLAPAVSDFRARSFYRTHDIAPLLRKGPNCVGLWLGRGWCVAGQPGVEADGPVVRFQAEIALGEGKKDVNIVSDKTWKWAPSPYATLGPWRWDHFGGERYDARLENPAWNSADFDDARWNRVEVVGPPPGRAQAQPCPPNRIGQRIPAVTCTRLGDGLDEVDFGTNLTGWLRMRMPRLARGQRIVIHYADRRYAKSTPEAMPPGASRHGSDETFETADGKFRYQTFHQVDELISAGRPNEEFCSKFNYHGFRRAVIEGLPEKPDPADVEALLIESDLEPAGSFTCSNERINRIHGLNLWTLRCLNLGGYLVDCPHRERLGYGDGQVSAETCLMNFWMPNFYAKWLTDWRDGQDPRTGELPHVAPRNPGGGGPGWGGALAALAWRTYLHHGDRRVLEACYDPMRRYLEFLESRCSDGILRAYDGKWDFIGDWVPPRRGMDTTNWPNARANELFNNCYRVYLWELLEKSASALHREDEARRCRETLDRIRPLIHQAFHDRDKHAYVPEEQSYQCFPLLVGIVPEAERNIVSRKLEECILTRDGGHLDTGMLGTYFLIQYLSAARRNDLLWTIVNRNTYPGWGYMLQQDATTMWEQWNGYYSHIHSCFTSIAGWFHNDLAGIRPELAAPGFKKIIIRPAVVGDLTWVKSEYRSIHGTITSNWKRQNGKFTLTARIPANTTATVHVPTKDTTSVTESGHSPAEAEGVTWLRDENGFAVFRVLSGEYVFGSDLD